MSWTFTLAVVPAFVCLSAFARPLYLSCYWAKVAMLLPLFYNSTMYLFFSCSSRSV